MTAEQYERLQPYLAMIKSNALQGKAAADVVQVYKELTGDWNWNAQCKSCVHDMFNYMKHVIVSHEKSIERWE